MYEEHFGLKKRPFPTPATGSDVFVGPQSALVIAAITKGLSTEDAVATVSGPAGVGKTTVVKRAVDGVGELRIVVSVGRIQLGQDEVIELLMAGLGAQQLPKSMVHRFAAFRRLLQQYALKKKRVVIVVEDAARVGIQALSELEALTAEDAGVSDGANIILMGDASLAKLLREPQLARLRQRMRVSQTISPLKANELLGYLKHSFRQAGGDFNSIFAAGSAELLFALSDGIPRVVNNLVKSSLIAAAESDQRRVTGELIQRIANDEFGLTATHSVAELAQYSSSRNDVPHADELAASDGGDRAAPEIDARTQAATEPAAAEEIPVLAMSEPEPEPEVEVEPEPEPKPEPEPEPTAVPAASQPTPEASVRAAPLPEPVADEVPEFIQDTLPDLQVLAPDLTRSAKWAQSLRAEQELLQAASGDTSTELTILPVLAATDDDDDDLPTLYNSTRLGQPATPAPLPQADFLSESVAIPEAVPTPVTAAVRDEVEDWDRDPTLAELKPDLEALERAMAMAYGSDSEPEAEPVVVPAVEHVAPVAAAPAPEITLDRQIQEKINEATEALRNTHFDLSADDLAGTATQAGNESGQDTAELRRIVSSFSNAKTIEDIDAKMAETLFGAEFSMIAAAVAAKGLSVPSANDELELQLDEPAEVAEAATAAKAGARRDVSETRPKGTTPVLDNSPSQRLATVRALNSSIAPPGAPSSTADAECIVMAADEPADLSWKPENQPDSIEDQIETSMTAKLRALSIPQGLMPNDDDEDGNERKKGGFLSRFRRS